MSKFFVGQRVKKVSGGNLGLEGVVVGLFTFGPGDDLTCPIRGNKLRLTNRWDLQVVYDHAWTNVSGVVMSSDTIAYCLQDSHEPILPEGAQPSTWEQCLWQPDHLRDPA